ncbi:ABATE domain-containing protein [Actinoallomurus acanthiterrae]
MSEEFALMLPDEPAPVRLMNTIWADRAGVHDALRTADDLRAWLRAIGDDADGDASIDRRDVEALRSLRDALRRLAALLTEDSREAAASPTEDVEQAVADLNQAVTRATTWPQLSVKDGRLRRWSTGTESAAERSLSAVAAEAVDLFTGPDQERLRACYAPGCVLYFVKDHPRREWCSTACGNRVRAARHYRRHRS